MISHAVPAGNAHTLAQLRGHTRPKAVVTVDGLRFQLHHGGMAAADGEQQERRCEALAGERLRTTRLMSVRGSVADAARMTDRISASLCLQLMRSCQSRQVRQSADGYKLFVILGWYTG